MTQTVTIGGANVCALHKTHDPVNVTVEWHHVIPVAWQVNDQVPKPPVAPYPGRDPDGRGYLWDARGMWLCPTGHRNVHHWIVRLMHAIRSGAADPAAAFDQAIVGHDRRRLEPAVALPALDRFVSGNPAGTLELLVSLHEYGED